MDQKILGKPEVELVDALARRRSPKVFTNTSVVEEALQSMLEAARWAPSSRNEQPWRFVVEAKGAGQSYEALLSALSERNRIWAATAPVLIVAIAKLFHDRDGKENTLALYDLGGAIAGLTVQAVESGLQVHQMAGFDTDRVREIYGIPDQYAPVTILAVGEADEESLAAIARSRISRQNLLWNFESTRKN